MSTKPKQISQDEKFDGQSPHIGIFFFVNGKIFHQSKAIGDVKESPFGFKDFQGSHYEYWNVVRFFMPETKEHDYDYYSRGRVLYNIKDDTFLIWLDSCINDFDSHELIRKTFFLQDKNVVFDHDEHYQCAICNAEYVDI